MVLVELAVFRSLLLGSLNEAPFEKDSPREITELSFLFLFFSGRLRRRDMVREAKRSVKSSRDLFWARREYCSYACSQV